jgi:hypothetical protein
MISVRTIEVHITFLFLLGIDVFYGTLIVEMECAIHIPAGAQQEFGSRLKMIQMTEQTLRVTQPFC